MNFILEQLVPTYKKLSKEYLKIDYISYGHATEKRNGLHWEFTCQHGPQECVGNRVHSCAVKLFEEVPALWVNFLECYAWEFNAGPADTFNVQKASQYCAGKSLIDFKLLWDCANGELGEMIEHDNALTTGELQPQLASTPWIVLNGTHTNAIQNEALTDLPNLICSQFAPTEKPAGCS